MNINVRVIEHKDQRYNTCGDWWFDSNGDLEVRVSRLGDWRMEFLVTRHEIDEAMLCKAAGVTAKQVDEYDLAHEDEVGTDDLSNCPDAPYYLYHNDALAFEWQMARLLGIDWRAYSKVMDDVWVRK